MRTRILYTIVLFLTATVNSWGRPPERVLYESEITREGQPVKLRVLLREIEFRGVKRLGTPPPAPPPRQGMQISVTRQIGADGPELELYRSNYDMIASTRLADSGFRAQLQTDGETIWVYLSDSNGGGRGEIREMPLMARGDPMQDHYDYEEVKLQSKAGTRSFLSYRNLGCPFPPKGMESPIITPFPEMTLEKGMLCFDYAVYTKTKEKLIVRYTPDELASKLAPPSAYSTQPEQPAPPTPSPSGAMPKPNAGEVNAPQAPTEISVRDNPSHKWLLWAAAAVLAITSVGFLLKRHQK